MKLMGFSNHSSSASYACALASSAVMTRLITESGPMPAGQFIEQPEARVMPRARVLVARIAEPDDELERQGLERQG